MEGLDSRQASMSQQAASAESSSQESMQLLSLAFAMHFRHTCAKMCMPVCIYMSPPANLQWHLLPHDDMSHTMISPCEGLLHADSGPPSTSDIQDWPDAPLLVRPKALPYQNCSNLTRGAVQINTGRCRLLSPCLVIVDHQALILEMQLITAGVSDAEP